LQRCIRSLPFVAGADLIPYWNLVFRRVA